MGHFNHHMHEYTAKINKKITFTYSNILTVIQMLAVRRVPLRPVLSHGSITSFTKRKKLSLNIRLFAIL
jgi:hypothetical protein